jgi:hypothetical protein
VWPYVDAFYVVAALASGNRFLAEAKLEELARINTLAQDRKLSFGFNEWLGALDGAPQGQDWQTWSAAMYLYAAECVLQNRVLFFE